MFTKLVKMQWFHVIDEVPDDYKNERTMFLIEATINEETNDFHPIYADFDNKVFGRLWKDQEAAEKWITFITELAKKYSVPTPVPTIEDYTPGQEIIT